MDALRIVVGYHGCARSLATELLGGDLSRWRPSMNPWDWLGHGIYFFEWDLERALRWSRDKYAGTGEDPAVIGAIIRLDSCFDLTSEAFTRALAYGYRLLQSDYQITGKRAPANASGADRKRRELDCVVINTTLERLFSPGQFTSVRGPFLEGPEAYPGAMIRRHTHIQIAVRDSACIQGIFMPNLAM
jgi:hypothetical protein